MKSDLNFKVVKNDQTYDLHDLGIWVESFHIYSPNAVKNKLHVPGMNGSHLMSSRMKERQVFIALQIESDDVIEFDDIKHTIFDLFYSDHEYSIIRDSRPDRELMVLQEGTYDIDNITTVDGELSFTLTMIDPFLYGPERTAILNTATGTVINVEGTAETKPIFELDVTQDTTYTLVSNEKGEYMMIGNPANIEQISFQKYERIFYTDATSLVGWANANSGEIDGVVAGTMETNGTRFQASSFGTGTGWHGPAIKQSLTEPLTNFRLEAFIALYNGGLPEYVGRDEVYLLDVNGNQICKLAMKDTQIGRALGFGEARIGTINDGYYLINEFGDREGVWNDYYGIVRIERNNNKWSAYFAMVDSNTGKHHTRRYMPEWEDKLNQYSADATQIVVHFGQYGTYQVPAHGLYSASVYKINNQPDAIPYIAEAGDKVIFNHQTNELLINGEPIKKLKDFGGTYFSLPPGENTIAILGADSGVCKYKPAYK